MNTDLFFKLLLFGFSMLGLVVLVTKLFPSNSGSNYTQTNHRRNVSRNNDGDSKRYRVNRYGQIFEE